MPAAPEPGTPTWALVVIVVIALAGFTWSALLLLVTARRRRTAHGKPQVVPERPPTRPSLLHVVGGANIPTKSLRLNATWPLATFDWDGEHIAVIVRPPWFGGIPLYATREQLTSVYAASAPMGLGLGGVGFCLQDGREWYLWTRQADVILTVLGQAGFPVSFQRRRPKMAFAFFPKP